MSGNEPEHDAELILVCKHIDQAESLIVEGGEEASVMCEKCHAIDWSKVDWDKVHEITEKSKKTSDRRIWDEAPKEMENLQLACRSCTLDMIAKKLELQGDGRIESLGPCNHCGKQVLVKHGLSSGIKRMVAANPTYHFDIGVDERELVITIRKRGSSRVTEPQSEE